MKSLHRLARLLTPLLVAATLPAAAAVVASGGYIAGDGFTLRDTFDQARREHGAGSFRPFWLLVLDGEVSALVRRTADRDIQADVAELQRRGATLYVCARDLRGAALDGVELLPGVQVVRGWSDAESGIQDDDGNAGNDEAPAPLSPLRAVNRLCADTPPSDDSR